MNKESTTDEKTVVSKIFHPDSESLLIKKELSELPLEESKPYLDTDTTSQKSVDCDKDEEENTLKSHEIQQADEQIQIEKSIPSVEVSQHAEEDNSQHLEDNVDVSQTLGHKADQVDSSQHPRVPLDKSQHPEVQVDTSQQLEVQEDKSRLPAKDVEAQEENSLSVIEEEKSATSSVSELITAEELEEITVETDVDVAPIVADNNTFISKPVDPPPSTAMQTTTLKENLSPTSTANSTAESQTGSLSKQNEVLRSRISELVEQLQRAKKEIERLRNLLIEYSDEANNPTILKAKLASQVVENEALKQRLKRDATLVVEAVKKEKQLEADLMKMRSANNQLCGTLSQKEAAINDLDCKIQDFTITLNNIRRNSVLSEGKECVKDPVICQTPTKCMKRNQDSKVCVIL